MEGRLSRATAGSKASLSSLSELRLAYKARRLSQADLAALEHDPRAGARALWALEQAAIAAQAQERARIFKMLRHERALWGRGVHHVGGLDEVGVGPLLGPVVAAVVVLPAGVSIEGIDDSKKLSHGRRVQLDKEIRAQALGVGMGQCSALEIDAMNIHRATREAMRRALVNLPCALDHVLVDAHRVPGTKVTQTAIIGGDRVSHAIAAASIVAKVARDAMITALDGAYPGYGLAQHKGYGTAMHLEALAQLGPTPHHRQSFAPVRAAVQLRSAR